MKYKFLKTIDDTVYFDGELMEIYVPKLYFEQKSAKFQGDKITTIGIFNFIVYADKDRKSINNEIHSLELPMPVTFTYVDYYESDSIQNIYKDNYYVFLLERNCVFIDSIIKERSAANTKDFLFKFHSGKLNKTVNYDDILKIYMESTRLNDVKLNNPAVMFEMIIAELCRSKEDDSIPFRKAINENNSLTQNDYKMINITQLPNINSTFASMTFEDIDQSIHYSLLKTKNNDKETESPLENIIKY